MILKIHLSTKFQVSSLYRSRITVSTDRSTYTHMDKKTIFLGSRKFKTDIYTYYIIKESKKNINVIQHTSNSHLSFHNSNTLEVPYFIFQ